MNREFITQLNAIVSKYWRQRDGEARRIRESFSGNGFAPSSPCVAGAILKQSLSLISAEVVDRFFRFCKNKVKGQFKDIQHGVRPPDQAFNPFLKDSENGLLAELSVVFRNLKEMAAKNPIQAVGKNEIAQIELIEAQIQFDVTKKFERGRQQFADKVLRLKCSQKPSGISQTETEANRQSVMADSANEDSRFEYFGPVPNFPLLSDRDTHKTAKNDTERRRLEAEGYQAPSPGWPPIGWVTGYRPQDDSLDAICQWLACQSQALCLLEQWQDAGDENLNSLDVNGNPQDATDIVRDAYLLVKALKKKGWQSPSTEPRGRVSFRDARIGLDELLDWIQTSAKQVEANAQSGAADACASTTPTGSAMPSDSPTAGQQVAEPLTKEESPKSQERSNEATADDKSEARIVAAIADLLEKPKRKRKKVRQAEKTKEEQRLDDAKLGDAWLSGHKSGKYVKYADMPNTGLELWDVKASLDRDRHNRPNVWKANAKPRRKKVVKTH